jgi:formate C-acetyltransferase
MTHPTVPQLTYQDRIDRLRATKLRHTQEKLRELGSSDMDDLPVILPPAESRKMARVVNGSGVLILDALFKDYVPKSNHPSGGIFGARACGENIRALLDLHPPYVDPLSSLAGAYMSHFTAYRQPAWNPDFDYSHLHENQRKYKLLHGIGAVQHFCQDEAIGLTQGWGGILGRIRHYRTVNLDAEAQELYDGLEHMVLGLQNWISRHAATAASMAEHETHPATAPEPDGDRRHQ